MSFSSGPTGIHTFSQRPDYKTYQSPHGPNYKIRKNFHGIDLITARRFGITMGSFGVVAGIFALFFFSDVPKVRKDIMSKMPLIGDQFIREKPPSDNPF